MFQSFSEALYVHLRAAICKAVAFVGTSPIAPGLVGTVKSQPASVLCTALDTVNAKCHRDPFPQLERTEAAFALNRRFNSFIVL